MFCERIFKALSKQRIKYLAVGGVAVNLYGFHRTTGDLDIIISFKEANLTKFLAMVKRLKLKPRQPVRLEGLLDSEVRKSWVKNKNMKVFSLYNPKNEIESIDVLLDEGFDFDKLYKRKKNIRLTNFTIPLIHIDDLISMKKKVARKRDQIDIEALKQIKGITRGKKS